MPRLNRCPKCGSGKLTWAKIMAMFHAMPRYYQPPIEIPPPSEWGKMPEPTKDAKEKP